MKSLFLKQRARFPLALLVLIAVTAGCGRGKDGQRSGNGASPLPPLDGRELPGDRERFPSYVISVKELQEIHETVIVLDARIRGDYGKGHLPGALPAHWTDWSNVSVKQGERGWAELLPFESLKKKLGALGIDGKKPVVIYSDSRAGWGDEGRQLWALRVYGIAGSYILDGGIEAWKKAGGRVVATAAAAVAVDGPEPKPDLSLLAGTEYLAGRLGAAGILDVREEEEFAGRKTYGEKRKGRIPFSKHLWFRDFYNTDGTLQRPSQIRARVESLGFKPDDEIISYCTGGVRSGFATMILRIAGYRNARNYCAGFSEWAGTGQKIDEEVRDE